MNSRSLISSIVYPPLTVLPITLLMGRELEQHFFISGIYPVITILLCLFIYPLYRLYCSKNRYEFEAVEGIPSNKIIIFSIIISSLISILLLKVKVFFIFISIPLFLIMLFTYWLTSVEIIQDESSAGLIRVMNNHLKSYTLFIQFYIVIKIIFLVSIYLWKYYQPYLFFPFLLSFTADFFLLIVLRNLMYSHNLRQEGVGEEVQKRKRGSLGFVFFLIIAFIAFLAGRARSILSYKYIEHFLNWLSNLSNSKYTGDILIPDTAMRKVNNGDFFTTTGIRNKNIEAIWAIVEKLLIVAAILLVGYFVFYPLISPFFKKDRTKISLKKYYTDIIRNIFSLLVTIKDYFVSLFSVETTDRIFYKREVVNTISITETADKKKRRELKKILKLYIKVLNWAKRKRGVIIGKSRSVTDLIGAIPVFNSDEEKHRDNLQVLFNRAFFSPQPLIKADYRKIKFTFKELSR